MNVILQIFPFIAPEFLLSNNECMSYRTNQVLLHSPWPVWSHVFVVLTSFLHYFHDYDACTVCHQLQENNLSHLAFEELGSIVQAFPELFKFIYMRLQNGNLML